LAWSGRGDRDFFDFEWTIGDWLRRGEDCGFHDVFILGFRDGRRMRDVASEQQVPIRSFPSVIRSGQALDCEYRSHSRSIFFVRNDKAIFG